MRLGVLITLAAAVASPAVRGTPAWAPSPPSTPAGLSMPSPASTPAGPSTPAPASTPAGPSTPSPASSPAATAAPPWKSLLEIALDDHTDLLLLPRARRPAPRPVVTAATRVMASPTRVAAVLLNPAWLRQALPALVRADVVATRAAPVPGAWPDRLIAWEVEIPLFNLTGHAWLKQLPDGTELTLIDGAFAPGQIRFQATPTKDGHASILTCEMSIEVQSANWIFRRVARHDPWAETAMSAATASVMARAVALRAEVPPGASAPPARAQEAIRPPPATALDGMFLADAALAGLRSVAVVAAIRRKPSGRLAWSSIAVQVPGVPARVGARLATPETWSVFPEWKSVRRRATRAGTTNPESPTPPPTLLLVDVEDNMPLVNLDAVWRVDSTHPVRATAVDGDTRDAVFTWQTPPGDGPQSSIAVLSMHPHLDAAGFIQRRLIAAEPLLEHGFAVALTYVDAAAVAESLDRAPVSASSSIPVPALGSGRPTPGPPPAGKPAR